MFGGGDGVVVVFVGFVYVVVVFLLGWLCGG